ncbi:MAG: hypothetical protein ACYC0V_21725 [Armatimonadota bacterium]
MSTRIGKLNIDYLQPPEGVTYEFITYLAGNANRIGRGSSIGFYLKEQMETSAGDFFNRRGAEPGEDEEVNAWIEALPWTDNGCLALAFNW